MSTFGLGPGGAALAVLLVWVGRQISVPYEGVMSSPQPSLGLGTPLGSRPKGMGQAERSRGREGKRECSRTWDLRVMWNGRLV